ncbi:MAG: M28 family peptidase [Planctomycetaceae bacterium]
MLRSIQEKQVLETVSFLASDKMNGRDTPSKELDVAANFVAERFRKASLEGLGPGGSFFQTTELFRTSAPISKAVMSVGTDKDIQLTVLTGISEVIKVSGVVHDDAAKDKPTAGIEKPMIVVMDELPLPPQAADNPIAALVTYVRRTLPLVRQSAKVVLVRVSDDSVLFDAAATLQQHPVSIPAQFEPQCAIVLISKTQALEGEVSLEIPANIRQAVPVHNVVGVLRGSDPEAAKQAVIISAHLDHIGPAGRGDDKVNNGADDNASGVTGVVTLADAICALEERPQRSVIFMTFWGEEKGLLGSKYFAEHPLWNLDDVVCNINLEMIGRPEENAEGKAWGTGWPHSTLGPQMAAGAMRADVTVFHHEQFSEMLYARSDNASFVAKGVIAHSFSAGSLHNDYHQPTDEVEKLNIPHMTKIIQGLLAGILPIARGELTPTAIP